MHFTLWQHLTVYVKFERRTMCGIFCKYSSNCTKSDHLETDCKLKKLLYGRGPDAQSTVFVCHANDCIQFTGCTLWTQGKEPEIQPLDDENGCLLFNGDIFDDSWNKNQSDTEQLFERLNSRVPENGLHVIYTLRCLNGPFSLIYFDKRKLKLYFCRDKLGRHSLLFYKTSDGFIISSVLTTSYEKAIEISSGRIYCFDLTSQFLTSYSWKTDDFDIFIRGNRDWILLLKKEEEEFLYNERLPTNEDNLLLERIMNIANSSENQTEVYKKLFEIPAVQSNVEKVIHLLSQSIKHRVETCPENCKNCDNSKANCVDHCSIGILFSGGLDCTVIAAIANDYVSENRPIDLINVAFEKIGSTNYDVPDRITARRSHIELQKLFPKRKWNLVEINVPLSMLHEKQAEVIVDLVHPLRTVLDESLGSALWFAARGETENYKSPCRILLLGMGADELFGGYMRHRNAFKRRGWCGLEKELQRDWQRIASRNLARDDRVISYHGRQPRQPYLDENFSDFIVSLKPWEKCIPSEKLGPGIGDKWLLRLVASRFGLSAASSFPKRAIQFGSRIANKKENAADTSKRLLIK